MVDNIIILPLNMAAGYAHGLVMDCTGWLINEKSDNSVFPSLAGISMLTLVEAGLI